MMCVTASDSMATSSEACHQMACLLKVALESGWEGLASKKILTVQGEPVPFSLHRYLPWYLFVFFLFLSFFLFFFVIFLFTFQIAHFMGQSKLAIFLNTVQISILISSLIL